VKYQAVLFDMDGVIFDGEPMHYRAAQSTFDAHGYELSYDDYREYFGGQTDRDGFARYCSHIGAEHLLERLLKQKAEAYQRVAAEMPLVPCSGVLETIRWLLDQSTPLALVTGSLRSEAELVLRSFDIQRAFQTIITAEDVRNGKPDPEGYLKAATALGVEPSACVVIEDAPSGIAAARTANMRCVAVTTTYAANALSEATRIVNGITPHCFKLLN
jgi:beta-phosphoglucomutase